MSKPPYKPEYKTAMADAILNRELIEGLHDLVKTKYSLPKEAAAKSAFVPGSAAAGGMPPAQDPSADPSMAMMGAAPPMDPAMMDPAMMGGAPPMDPMMGGAPPMDPMMGGAPPMDPAAGGAPPPPGGDTEMMRQIIREELANLGNAGDAGKPKGAGKAQDVVMQEIAGMKKALVALMNQMGAHLPPDFMLPPEEQGQEQMPQPDMGKTASPAWAATADAMRAPAPTLRETMKKNATNAEVILTLMNRR
jgi:hypothetical protein